MWAIRMFISLIEVLYLRYNDAAHPMSKVDQEGKNTIVKPLGLSLIAISSSRPLIKLTFHKKRESPTTLYSPCRA
ncbi:hypothetical protein KCV06_g110, partial [Aureobasidium melanogenum]